MSCGLSLLLRLLLPPPLSRRSCRCASSQLPRPPLCTAALEPALLDRRLPVGAPGLACAETKKMAERLEWVDKRSSRIWRGRLEARYWRYIKGSGERWLARLQGEQGQRQAPAA